MSLDTPPPPIKTPCVKVCVVDGASKHCLGCGRSLNEIAAWAKLSAAARDQIMAELPERLHALADKGLA